MSRPLISSQGRIYELPANEPLVVNTTVEIAGQVQVLITSENIDEYLAGLLGRIDALETRVKSLEANATPVREVPQTIVIV